MTQELRESLLPTLCFKSRSPWAGPLFKETVQPWPAACPPGLTPVWSPSFHPGRRSSRPHVSANSISSFLSVGWWVPSFQRRPQFRSALESRQSPRCPVQAWNLRSKFGLCRHWHHFMPFTPVFPESAFSSLKLVFFWHSACFLGDETILYIGLSGIFKKNIFRDISWF